MDLISAIALFQLEVDNNTSLTTTQRSVLQNCIDVIEDKITTCTKPDACELLNILYWEAGFNDKNLFGQAVFCTAYTVDPNRPFPTVRV